MNPMNKINHTNDIKKSPWNQNCSMETFFESNNYPIVYQGSFLTSQSGLNLSCNA